MNRFKTLVGGGLKWTGHVEQGHKKAEAQMKRKQEVSELI